jgi:hypothetical protein
MPHIALRRHSIARLSARKGDNLERKACSDTAQSRRSEGVGSGRTLWRLQVKA